MSRFLKSVIVVSGLLTGAAQAQWLDTTVGVGSGPSALVYNSVNNKVYCANEASDNVTVIDGASNQVDTTVVTGSSPCALCYNLLDNKVYCANSGSGSVTVIDGTTSRVITTVGAGSGPCALCVNPDDDKVYCVNEASGSVTVINGASNQVITTIGLEEGSSPRALCYDNIDDRVCAAKSGAGSVAIIDGRTNQVLTAVGAPDVPFRLCYNSDNDEAYCRSGLLTSSQDVVEAIGGASDSVLYVVFVGLGLGAIDYYLGTGRVYCANDDSNSVSVIDPVSHHVIAVPAGHGPCALGYSTASNKVYCANGRDSTVTVIDGATNSVLKTMTVGASPIALTCNPVQNRVYVANYGSNSISVVRDSALDVAERATPTGRRLALEAEPNPFSGRISLRLTANGSRPEVRIYDVNGALVRSFPEIRDSPQRDSPRFLVWDGTDGMGRRLPTGVYVVRLTDGANCVQRKVLLLR